MSTQTRFAGSRSLDERRRRRLAVSPDSPNESRRTKSDQFESEETDSVPVRGWDAADSFLRSVIPAARWKHCLIAIATILAAAGLIAGGIRHGQWEPHIGPYFAGLFQFEQSPLLGHFKSVLLILSSQLALIIRWVRCQGPNDFSGRYRIWNWVALALVVLGVSSPADLPGHIARTMEMKGIFHVPNGAILAWLLPVGALGGLLLWKLQREMKDCRTSRALLWMAAICGGASCWLSYPIAELEQSMLASAAAIASILGHLCLFLSTLVHTRFVIHVTADPPAEKKRTSRLRSATARWQSRKSKAAAATFSTEDVAVAETEVVQKPSAWRRLLASIAPERKSSEPPAETPKAPRPRKKKPPAAPPQSQSNEPSAEASVLDKLQDPTRKLRIDPAEEHEPYASKTKKRKRSKQLQRAN